jgi:hypothetical protein
VLTSDEQRIWEEIVRTYPAEGAEPRRRAHLADEVPTAVLVTIVAVVVGLWATVVLVLVGAFTAAVTVGLATALGWLFVRSEGHAHDTSGASSPGDRPVPAVRRVGERDRTSAALWAEENRAPAQFR